MIYKTILNAGERKQGREKRGKDINEAPLFIRHGFRDKKARTESVSRFSTTIKSPCAYFTDSATRIAKRCTFFGMMMLGRVSQSTEDQKRQVVSRRRPHAAKWEAEESGGKSGWGRRQWAAALFAQGQTFRLLQSGGRIPLG